MLGCNQLKPVEITLVWKYFYTQVEKSDNPLCTHMYAVTKEGTRTIIKDLLPLKLLNIDQYIAMLVRQKKLRGIRIEGTHLGIE